MNDSRNSILIPIDFSKQSLIALEQSYNLANYTRSKIILIHVVKESSPLWGLMNFKEKDDFKFKIEKKLQELSKKVQEKTNTDVKIIVEHGKVVDSILYISNKLNVNFIFMGTSGSTDIRKKIIGSNALRIIKEAKCPVVTVKGKFHRDGCKNIILPIDTTKQTLQKIANVVQFASLFNSNVSIISVISTKNQDEIKQTENKIIEVENIIKSYGLNSNHELLVVEDKSELAKGIIKLSHKLNGDLITIMTQQENDFVSFFIGSLAKELIHSSDIPILSINPK